jgi:hypothetical protein
MISSQEIIRIDPFDPPLDSLPERESMEAWVEFHRATLLLKCADLEADQLIVRSCPPSKLSLLGLVRHMATVESWFSDFAAVRRELPYWSPERRDMAFDDLDPATAEADIACYMAAVDRSRAAVIGVGLDERCPCDHCEDPKTLRWVYQHMLEEYARHNGHADLLREAIDGRTGD